MEAEHSSRRAARACDVLSTVYDPEIPVDIYELGLIYDLDVDEAGGVKIRMTLTSPMCPVAETLPPEVEAKARGVEGVSDVEARPRLGPALEPEHDVGGGAPRARDFD